MRTRTGTCSGGPHGWPTLARASARWVVAIPLLFPLQLAHAAAETVYVALGSAGEPPDSSRSGDPALVAQLIGKARGRVRLIDLTAQHASARVVRETQLMHAISSKPNLVTISVAAVDACGQTPLSSFARDLETIADLIERTRATVIISTIGHAGDVCNDSRRGARDRVDSFNFTILRIARRHRFLVADVRKRNTLQDQSWVAAIATAMATATDRSGDPQPSGRPPEKPRRPSEPIPVVPDST